MSNLDYNAVREVIRDISSHHGESRSTYWFNDEIGVARGQQDRIEIFLPGEPLISQLPAVSRLMQHGRWLRRERDTHLDAARLLLPTGDEYDAIAATIIVELSCSGLEQDRQRAFSRCEALIEVALAKADLAAESVLGLWGELYLLQLWLRAERPSLSPLDQWLGYRPSVRDFVVGRLGVEVKTTLGSTSSHQVSGMHQTEPTPSDTQPSEEQLLLVSLGLTRSDQGASVLGLIGQIDALVREQDPTRIEDFHTHVSDYASRGTGYWRANENQPPLLDQRYGVSFARGYDMGDPSISVLRLADVQARPYVQTDSVTFRINLPNRLQGDLNPLVGVPAVIERLVRAGGSLP